MSFRTPDTFFAAALAALRAGQYSRAEQGFKLFLQSHPRHFGALNLISVALVQQGRYADALTYCQKALKLNPTDDATQANHGRILRKLNQPEQAFAAFSRALGLNPRDAELWMDSGVVLNDLGQFQRALSHFDKALALNPSFYGALYNKGNALSKMNRPAEALAAYDAALVLKPLSYESQFNRGNILKDMNRHAEALNAYDAALVLRNDDAELWCNRSIVLRNLNLLTEALADCDAAIHFNPDHIEAICHRILLLRDLNMLAEARAACDSVITRWPDHAPAYWIRSGIVLLQGEFARGFADYEWRRKAETGPKFNIDDRYLWLGEHSLSGKILFIPSELFLGDMIQFCRYAVLAEQEGAHVVLAAPRVLHQLLRSLSPTIALIDKDARPARFDYYCPLMSLPLAFLLRPSGFPAQVPYLAAEPERIARWRAHLGPQGFKIGICWQGSTESYAVLLRRSFELHNFQGLGGLPGVRLISLQKHDGLDQLANLPAGMKVETLGEGFDSGADAFLDTAAVMESLDLIISTDTAIAHLAGALARPTWLGLRDVPDWRWMLERNDCPWYPTMRLFRQRKRDAWDEVFLAMEQTLSARLESF